MIPLYKPHMPEVPLVDMILHSGQLAHGKYGIEFENSLREYIGNSYVVITNTFNMAILVALTTLGIKAGDIVIASPMACLASTQPLLSMGVKVKWCDIDPTTGTLDPDSVKKLIHLKPKAIMHNHFCGYIGYIDEINRIGEENGIPIIDDCIEAFGGEYKGKKMGNTGADITVFSFGPVRIPNTLDGGAITFKDRHLFEKSILVRDCGIDRRRFRDELGEINPDCDIELVGHSATMDELSSYIGIRQMEKIGWITDKQRKTSSIWDKKLADNSKIASLKKREGVIPNYWIYGILVEDKREAIVRFRRQGYFASGVHINNNRYSVFEDRRQLKGTNEFYERFVALPCGWWIEDLK